MKTFLDIFTLLCLTGFLPPRQLLVLETLAKAFRFTKENHPRQITFNKRKQDFESFKLWLKNHRNDFKNMYVRFWNITTADISQLNGFSITRLTLYTVKRQVPIADFRTAMSEMCSLRNVLLNLCSLRLSRCDYFTNNLILRNVNPSLKHLDIARIKDFRILLRFSNLESLSLSYAILDKTALRVLSGLEKLTELSLNRVRGSLNKLSVLNLRTLSLTFCSDISDISDLLKEGLFYLTISDCPNIPSDVLRKLPESIQEVSIDGEYSISNQGLSYLNERQLNSLTLCSRFSDKGLESLTDFKTQRLNCFDSPEITIRGISHAIKSWGIKHLTLEYVVGSFSPEDLIALKVLLKKLGVVASITPLEY